MEKKYACRDGVCPFALEPTEFDCAQCEEDYAREEREAAFDRELNQIIEEVSNDSAKEVQASVNQYYSTNPKEELPMTTQMINQTNVDAIATQTMEVEVMTDMTKDELRKAIKALDKRFVISNTSFKKIKKALLVDLLRNAKTILKVVDDENIQFSFDYYVSMAVDGKIHELIDAKVVSIEVIDASAASVIVDASVASNTVETVGTTPVVTVLTGLPRAGIKDGVLGLYVNKGLTEGIADLSYAQKQIDEMFAEMVALKTRVMELEGKQAGVVEQAPVVTKTEPIRTGSKPRYSREELEAMRAKAIAGNVTVTASSEQAIPVVATDSANGAYTKEKIEAMKAEAQKTHKVCQCGHQVTKANLAFVMRPKVQALIASEYKGVALCWHCQQSVLVGGVPFSVEERKAGVHKNVAKANVNLK